MERQFQFLCIRVRFLAQVLDTVQSYFAMRTIEVYV